MKDVESWTLWIRKGRCGEKQRSQSLGLGWKELLAGRKQAQVLTSSWPCTWSQGCGSWAQCSAPEPCCFLFQLPAPKLLSSRNTVVQRCITIVETRTSHWGLKKSICVLGGTVITRPGRFSFIQAPLIG